MNDVGLEWWERQFDPGYFICVEEMILEGN